MKVWLRQTFFSKTYPNVGVSRDGIELIFMEKYNFFEKTFLAEVSEIWLVIDSTYYV